MQVESPPYSKARNRGVSSRICSRGTTAIHFSPYSSRTISGAVRRRLGAMTQTSIPTRLAASARGLTRTYGRGDAAVHALGLLAAGIVPIPLDPGLTDDERAAVLADTRPHLVVTDPPGLAEVGAATVSVTTKEPEKAPVEALTESRKRCSERWQRMRHDRRDRGSWRRRACAPIEDVTPKALLPETFNPSRTSVAVFAAEAWR